MNEVVLIGRLTKDPELSYTKNQTAKCLFNIAVSRPKRDGEEQGADYPRVIAWKKQAESCGRYLKKGSQVAVRGSIRTGSYDNAVGVKVYTTDVWADRVEFLGGNEGRSNENAPRRTSARSEDTFDTFDDMPDSFSAAQDDIPF